MKIKMFSVLVVLSFFLAGATTTAQSQPQISGIRITGQPILVFDHLKDKKEPKHMPDIPPIAWKESNGTVNVTVSHFENYRLHGPDLEHITSDPNKIFSSTSAASDIVESHYNYHHWLSSPYTLDGKTIYALAHSEWYACLLNDDCRSKQKKNPKSANSALFKNYQQNSWVTTVTLFKSTDGGASWAPNGANEAHVVAKEGFYWTGSPALASAAYRKAMDHTGLKSPSRIIKEGNYYYSIGFLNHRDFSRIDSKTGEAPIDKHGYVLIRTADITRPSGWEAWEGGDHYSPITDGRYIAFTPKKNGENLKATRPQIIYDTKANNYVAIFTLSGKSPKVIYYMTTKTLANPSWSEAVAISGTETFNIDPRSPRPNLECNKGFSGSNYVSLIDTHSSGLNFEFTDGDPWLFYVVNPDECGGNNQARDIYRVQLMIDYR